MEWLLNYCNALVAQPNNVALSLLVAGLLGSLAHCSTMCGPMVITQMLDPSSSASPKLRLLGYHTGRISTYAALGAVAGVAGHLLFSDAGLSHMAGIALFIAGAIFLFSALNPKAAKPCQCDETRNSIKRLHASQLPPFAKAYLRGVLLGFMPCGLVMAALLVAATMSSPFASAGGMVLFGLGTVPLLQAMGMGAYRLARNKTELTARLGKGAMTLNGLVLCGLGIHQW